MLINVSIKALWGVGVIALILILLFVVMLIYPRPIDQTPAWVFEGEAGLLDYCDLPELDGSGLLAADIPQGHTPGCGYERFPQPLLKHCTEPLDPGASDLRGLWQQVEGGRTGHVERIEQCGNRVVVTAAGVIHDITTDGRLAGASDDVRPFNLGPFELCIRTSATTEWKDGKLKFYALGGPHLVSQYLDGKDELLWHYPFLGITRMKRICQLPEELR